MYFLKASLLVNGYDLGSSVGVVTRLWAGWSRVPISLGATDFCLLRNIWLELEVNQTPPSSANVKNYGVLPLRPIYEHHGVVRYNL